MPVYKSRIDPDTDTFRENEVSMQRRIEDLKEVTSRINRGGDAKARENHKNNGKLPVRDRIQLLIDR